MHLTCCCLPVHKAKGLEFDEVQLWNDFPPLQNAFLATLAKPVDDTDTFGHAVEERGLPQFLKRFTFYTSPSLVQRNACGSTLLHQVYFSVAVAGQMLASMLLRAPARLMRVHSAKLYLVTGMLVWRSTSSPPMWCITTALSAPQARVLLLLVVCCLSSCR